MSVIITRPEHDITTRYLSQWGKKVIEFANQKKLEIVDLNKEKANKQEFTGRIKKINPKLVFLNGHGNDNVVTGHDNQILVEAGKNEKILSDRITYALSCNSAQILGKKVAKNNATAYIGYTDEFIFVINNKFLNRPLDDEGAKPFMEASNQVAISLLKGNTAQEASKRSKEVFEKNYTKLLDSNADQDSLQIAQCLWWNKKHQVCLGKQDMKFSKN